MKTFRAADIGPEHVALMKRLQGDLLIVFVARLLAIAGADKLRIPVDEIDKVPRGKGLAFSVDPATKAFTFEIRERAYDERN